MRDIAKNLERMQDSCLLCVFFTEFKLFPGNSITSITLQRHAWERPVESPPSEVFEGKTTVFKRDKYGVAKIGFRGQTLILVLLVCIGG